MAECSIKGCTNKVASRGWCSAHYTRWQRHGDPLFTTRTPPRTADSMEKRCPRCTKVKPIEQFGKRPNGKPKGYCQVCEDKYQRSYAGTEVGRGNHRKASAKWWSGNRDYILRYKYGIGVADYDRMFAEQDGKCAICGTDELGPFEYLCVDHCHDSNAVRGLLCHNCNRGIGFLGDDLERVRSAAAYLERHKM